MAAPSITRIDNVPASLAPGQSVDLTVVAVDPDSRTVTLEFTIRDSGGLVSAPSQVTVQVSDPVELERLTIISGGGTLVQTGPLTCRYTA